jgi:hypothetical protein
MTSLINLHHRKVVRFLLSLLIILYSTIIYAQVPVVNGLGQIECVKGCGTGGGGASGTVDIVAVNGNAIVGANLPVTFSNASINIGNFPATQTVSGSVSISNFPLTFGITQTGSNNDVDVLTLPAITIQNTGFNVNNIPHVIVDTAPSTAITNANLDAPLSGLITSATYTGRTPAGASPANGESNTNTALSRIGAYNFIFNGTSWDRWTGSTSVSNFPATQNIIQPDKTNTGTLTAAAQSVTLVTPATCTTSINVLGTWVGTLVFFGINGNGTSLPIYAYNTSTKILEAVVSVNGDWVLPSAGYSTIGVNANAWTSGTATIGLIASRGCNTVELTGPLPPGGNIIGGVNQSGTWTVQPGNTANTTAWLVNGPTLTKGTQGSNGYTTQDLKDAGRTIVTLNAERVVPILTTDTIVTVAKLVGDTVTAGVTTYQVTSGKTLRLQYIHISLTPSSTTLGVIQVRLRTLSSGACTVAAGLKVMEWELGNPGTATQVANAANVRLDAPFPDGVEFSGSTRNICISMNALAAAAQTVTISLVGYEY